MEKQIINLLRKIIKENYDIDLEEITLTNPPKKEMGDFAFSCFILSRELKKNPSIIASDLELLLIKECHCELLIYLPYTESSFISR